MCVCVCVQEKFIEKSVAKVSLGNPDTPYAVVYVIDIPSSTFAVYDTVKLLA